jgi:hypothetical protein
MSIQLQGLCSRLGVEGSSVKVSVMTITRIAQVTRRLTYRVLCGGHGGDDCKCEPIIYHGFLSLSHGSSDDVGRERLCGTDTLVPTAQLDTQSRNNNPKTHGSLRFPDAELNSK